MAIKAVNDTINLDKLILILLIYRVYLQMSNLNPFTPFIINQAVIIRKTIAEIIKL
jgi:hypothetical protein